MPYPALPAHRMAWDVDGTILRHRARSGAYSTQIEATRNSLNDEDTADFWQPEIMQDSGNEQHYIWIFPELRTVTHYFWSETNFAGSGTFELQYSTDSTDGSDGTWTAVGQLAVRHQALIQPYFRSAITAVTVNSGNPVKGIRIRHVSNTSTDYNLAMYAVHWYGSKVTPAGLAFWDPTANVAAPATFLDYGDASQGVTVDRTFRIKNTHATQQANAIILSATDVSGTMDLTFSIGGGAFQDTLDIGNLAAGVISGVITARRVVPGAETLRVQAVRVSAVPTSWT